VDRLALLPFENLTGDASLDWIASAAPSIVATQITGAANILPVRVETVRDAYLNRATRFVHGYFTRRGAGLHFQVEIEDSARHKMAGAGAADGTVLFAMNDVARKLAPGARPFSTANQDAVAAWGRGEFERAVTIDPDFGTAWTYWAQQLGVSGKPAEAGAVAARALARPSLRSPLDRAQLELISATIDKNVAGRNAALSTLVGMSPNDTSLLGALAETESLARRFPTAAGLYRRILEIDPGNAVAMNSLGYAEANAGHLDAATKALERYGKSLDQSTNSLDSLGEAYFMNGRFAEAERYFQQAYRRDPRFLAGSTLMKAAYAHWLGGDLAGADAIFQRYRDDRVNQKDAAAPWREATWLYATGRREQASAKLMEASADLPQLVQRQLAVWRGDVQAPQDPSTLKKLYDSAVPPNDGEFRTFYAAALAAAGNKGQATALLQRWPLPESGGDPLFQSLVYPEFMELRRQLGIK
jgi:tetratricopeptide (TPR) repeat protein